MSDNRKNRIRFSQARSLGVVMVLGVLLALIIYNTIAEGTPWASREDDVRLLMTLLSILLGLDVLVGKHREVLTIIGHLLIRYSSTETYQNAYAPGTQRHSYDTPAARRDPDHPPNGRETNRDRESDTDGDSDDDGDGGDDSKTGRAGAG